MKEKENWLSDDDSRIEPPPKIGRRKQKSARKLELERWRKRYKEVVDDIWDDDLAGVTAVLMLILSLITLFVCIDNVCGLEWMYGYLKVAMCIASFFVTALCVYGAFNFCIHILALLCCPYPLPKLNIKQTYKFGNQNGSK